jgi:energy-coupling factor transport system permease protein
MSATAPLPSARARIASPWHGLDPLTRLTVALGTMAAALILGGVACLSLLAALAVLTPAAIARELREVLRLSLLLALPLGVSVVLVNVLFSDGTTAEGARLAAEVTVRILTMAGAAVLFYRTTRPGELLASLQYHGLPARATFVIHNGVAMIPRLAERARAVTEAQRARGLDTEGNVLRRGRGLVALAAPTVLGAMTEVETRTLALETRGFTRPGRPTLLWTPRDGPVQRLARWGIAVALVVLVVARLTGTLPC